MKNVIILIFACTSLFFVCCESDKEIKIGILVPLSGNGAIAGEGIKRGIEMAVDEQNNKGGIKGKQVTLDIQDTKGEAKEGLGIIKKMLSSSNKPIAVFSAISGVALAITPETEKNQIVHFASVATPKLLDNTKFCIRNYLSAPVVAQKVVRFLKDSTSVKNLGVFYSNNEYGSSVSQALVAECSRLGVRLSLNEAYEEKSLDYKNLITTKMREDIDFIYCVGIGKGLGTIIKQVRESGYQGKIIGDPLVNFPDVINTAGPSLSGMSYLDFSYDKHNMNVSESNFTKAFTERYKTDPQILSLINYDACKYLFKSLGTGNSAELLMAQLINGEPQTGLSGTLRIENNEILHPLEIRTFK